jgi:hypothetical protein
MASSNDLDGISNKVKSAVLYEFLRSDWVMPKRSKTGEYAFGVKDMIDIIANRADELREKSVPSPRTEDNYNER